MLHNEYSTHNKRPEARPLNLNGSTTCLSLVRWHPLSWQPLWIATGAVIITLLCN